MDNIQVAILAGGLATRLGELTKNRPKSMLKIQGKPFLGHQLDLLRSRGIRDIVVCAGHLSEQIQDCFGDGGEYGVSIRYSIEDSPLGTAGALKRAQALLADPFFTLYGDSYLFVDFSGVMSFFKSRHKLGLLTVYQNRDQYDQSNTAIEENLVTKFSKTKKSKDMVYIDYGSCLLRKEVLQSIPDNQFYSLDNVFARLIALKELLAFEVKERFYEIGSLQGLKEFEQYLREAK